MLRLWHVDRRRARRRRGFTLIELIIVMLLLAIAAGMAAPRMSSFFRGRALNFEARRMLSLTHYAQSRAVAEGEPVVVWLDSRGSRYGVRLLGGSSGADTKPVEFTLEPSLTLQPVNPAGAPESELGDETMGLGEGLVAIRFNPDGFFDESSVQKVVFSQREGDALELVQSANKLGYELRPHSGAR